jgi:hypothetical protein
VRCGQCREVFNGFEALERFPGDDTGARLLALRAGRKNLPEAVSDLGDADVGMRVPQADATAAERAPPPSYAPADVPDLLLEPEPPAAEPPQAAAEAPPASTAPESRRRESAASAAILLPPPRPAPEPPSRAWSFGVALLSLVLAVQLVYAFRARLAQQYPGLRPVLEAACANVGCKVPWVNDESALKLDDSELLEVPGRPGQIALQARMRNLSPSPQEFPHIELTLTDITGQTAVRRVLRPTDYLGRALAPGEVMASGAEVLVSVRLETTRIRPTGYELMLFHP